MATEHSAFAASGEEAITRTLDIHVDHITDSLSPSEFQKFYEISRTAEEIVKGNYQRIALQFPDELLHVSVPVYRQLKANIGEGRELYVLADTSYGSCCVDEVAAQHVDADAVVHYGHACMTQTSRLPVIYVFGHKPCDISACIASITAFFQQYFLTANEEDGTRKPDSILLKHDVGYTHLADILRSRIEEVFSTFGVKTLYQTIPTQTTPIATTLIGSLETKTHGPQNVSHSATSVPTSEVPAYSSNPALLYIGGESLTLTNILMTHGLSDVFSCDPSTNITSLASGRSNRLLMRRYAAVQHARDADVFGILVGTLGVSSYLPLIRHIRTLLTRHKKKSYTISVGKLNPSKLANFLEIECFVLVACPENSVIEAKEFLRPIITPFELEVALQSTPKWTGRYVLNFETLLADAPESVAANNIQAESGNGGKEESESDGEDPDRPVFSLVTGTYRQAKRYGADENQLDSVCGPDSAIVLRNQDSTVAKLADSAAAMFLKTRTYQGLETRVGEDAPSVLEQGRNGIARGYRDVDHEAEASD